METIVATQTSMTTLNLLEGTEIAVSFDFKPEENGYLGKCHQLSAVSWGKTLSEAKTELLDAVLDTAEVLLEQSSEEDFKIDQRLKYAKIITSCSTKKQLKELLGL